MDVLAKKNMEAMIKNIKIKNLLDDILSDEELRKQALLKLNINLENKSTEINIEEVFKDKKYEKNIVEEVLKSNKYKTLLLNFYEKEIRDNYEMNFRDVDIKIKEMNLQSNELKEEINRLIKSKVQTDKELNILRDKKQEIDIQIRENKEIDNYLKEKREKRYSLNLEITELDEKKRKIESELKSSERFLLEKEKNKEEDLLSKEELVQEILGLKESKKELVQEILGLKESKKELIEIEDRIEFSMLELKNDQKDVENFKKNITEYLNKVRSEEREKNKQEIEGLEELLKESNLQIREQTNHIRRLENLNKPDYKLEELQEMLNKEKEENRELNEKLLEKNNDREIKSLKSEKEKSDKECEKLKKENTEIHNEKMELLRYKDRIENYEITLNELDRSKESLVHTIEEQRKEIVRLEGKGQSRVEKEQSIEAVPYFEVKVKQEESLEKDWLLQVENKFLEAGFKFPRRLLYAFHTSLKISDWSSLSVLAGVSGTGKSELPRLYSRYGGLNFLPLAVQPNWDSPDSLFGYYNSLEQKFNPTNLLKVLYQAQKKAQNSINDCVTLVLLDEMNLAHVELYFSELLSKLELLRGKKEGVDLEISLGDKDPYKINLNNSIMWVGTMNEDETTKSLSDKVIDRGNLINFPKPKKLITRHRLVEVEEVPLLLKSTWDDWKWKEEDEAKLKIKLEEIKKIVEDINEALEESGRAIGHRVWQSIEAYIKNYPLVLMNLDNEEELEKYVKVAFEDALVQKLIPKLRGLETSGNVRKECLDKIHEIIKIKASGIARDFETALNNMYGVFVWTNSSYLEEEI